MSFLFDLLVIVPHARHNILTGPVPLITVIKNENCVIIIQGETLNETATRFSSGPSNTFQDNFYGAP